ncbi:AAA family ATPase [Nocardioides sp.]|uniref:helix-turn-helix transcriptional regulator n=1 Tax=Nocardioides sp. TaxID=35761 RepID=UPI0031FEEB06
MDVAGREHERDATATFLAAAASAPAALSLTGDAGIGKTTLCRHTVAQAVAAGTTVLECRSTLVERGFSFVALTDLLAPVDDAMLDRLAVPQRDALGAATLRSSPGHDPPEARVIGTGLLGLLGLLAAEGPVLLVIDDEQWLDLPSHEALTFALRRVESLPIGLLTSRRSGSAGPPELSAALEAPGWRRELRLDGLSAGALFHVVRQELGVSLARPTLIRITEASAGNPYIAVELARNGLVVPDSLYSLTAERLAPLTPPAREAILAVACAGRPTTTLLAALGLREPLTEAEDAGIVAVEQGRVDFTHPLLASAALELATPSETRELHRRLAQHTPDPEARARHSALSTPDPDPKIAAALDAGVTSAVARGASSTATDLARLAVERTEDDGSLDAWRRRVRLAELLHVVGATAEAGEVLARLETDCPPGPVRATGWLILTEVAYQTSSVQHALDCASSALEDAGDDPALSVRSLLSMATLAASPEDQATFAARAQERLDGTGLESPELRAWALCEQVSARFHLGAGLDRAELDRALVLERSGRAWRSNDQVAAIRPVLLKWSDHLEEAYDALVELHAKAVEEGNEGLVPYALGHLSGVALRLGRTDEAAALAVAHLAHAESTGQESQRVQALVNTASVDAQCGRLEAASVAAERVLEWGVAEQDPWLEMSATGILGFLSLTRQDASSARQWFDRWATACEEAGVRDTGISRFHGDHIEALLADGAVSAAEERLDDFEGRADRAGRISAQAVARRSRGLLAATTGDLDSAVVAFHEALELHDLAPLPFERGRTLLLEGTTHRRRRAKREAARAVGEALEVFALLGATAWASRAEAELSRVGGRVESSLELTPSERRIAELAGSGLTNRQVAEQAFVSPKTVEANLARVYRKLGISSRAELGARMTSYDGT